MLLNDGEMGFKKRVSFGSSNDETRSIAVADINGDQFPDLIAGNIGQTNAIYVGDGTGKFTNRYGLGVLMDRRMLFGLPT